MSVKKFCPNLWHFSATDLRSFYLYIKINNLNAKLKATIDTPCRLCPHVIIVVGLDRFDDVWGYAVVPLMPGRSK